MTRIVTKPVMCESLLRFFLGTFLCVIPYLSALAEDYTEMHDGELNIQYIELEGNAFYPEYGLTQDVVKQHLKALHTTLGHKLKMKDIHNIADSVTLLYQEKGLTFHRVYVVPQEIKNSSLKLYVLKGKLAEIIIHNNSLYSKEQLLAPFKALIGQTIYEPYLKDAASKLSAKPGLKVFSYFSIGNKQGETRLNIRVLEESSSDTSISFDNYGVKQTGHNRFSLVHSRNNPFNQSGRLNVSLLSTNKSNNLFGKTNYELPIFERHSLGFSVLRSAFAVSGQFDAFGLDGKLDALNIYWGIGTKIEDNASSTNAYQLSLSAKRSKIKSELFPEFLSSKVNYIQLSSAYQLASTNHKLDEIRHSFSFLPSVIHIQDSDNTMLATNILLSRAYYQMLIPNWWSSLTTNHFLRAKLNGQWSSETLPSSEQYLATGANVNRGFEPGLFSGDWGMNLSIEQNFSSDEWFTLFTNTSIHPFIFVDLSVGKLKEGNGSSNFNSIGLGLNTGRRSSKEAFGLFKDSIFKFEDIQSSISIGYPLDYKLSEQANELDDKLTIYANLNLAL